MHSKLHLSSILATLLLTLMPLNAFKVGELGLVLSQPLLSPCSPTAVPAMQMINLSRVSPVSASADQAPISYATIARFNVAGGCPAALGAGRLHR